MRHLAARCLRPSREARTNGPGDVTLWLPPCPHRRSMDSSDEGKAGKRTVSRRARGLQCTAGIASGCHASGNPCGEALPLAGSDRISVALTAGAGCIPSRAHARGICTPLARRGRLWARTSACSGMWRCKGYRHKRSKGTRRKPQRSHSGMEPCGGAKEGPLRPRSGPRSIGRESDRGTIRSHAIACISFRARCFRSERHRARSRGNDE